MFNEKSVLITGGTGTFGQKFVETVLYRYRPRRLTVFGRDEWKLHEMSQRFGDAGPLGMGNRADVVRFVLGDVRDRESLGRAFTDVDMVVHAAALSSASLCERHPLDAIRTNILGAANVVDAAIASGVAQVIALSTDKAACPINLYGATKLCADKLLIAANCVVDNAETSSPRFSIVRCGNVIGSRGCIVSLFEERRGSGVLPITDPRMTRFLISREQSIDFVIAMFARMRGGETFVPKIPSVNILDLAKAVVPECDVETVGIQPGEKLHETLISEDESRYTLEFDDYYSIVANREAMAVAARAPGGVPCAEGFCFRSDTNDEWVSDALLRSMVGETTAPLRKAA